MREIKFRVWDKENMLMSFFDLFDSGKGGTQGTWRYKKGAAGEFGDYHERYINRWDVEENKVVLMQFTGLYSKSGVEIYEGDIVQVLRNKPRHEQNIEVLWMPKGSWNIASAAVSPKCEVIGNIYENPELLTPPTTE